MTSPSEAIAAAKEKRSKLQESQDLLRSREALAAAKSRHRKSLPGAVVGDQNFDSDKYADTSLRFDLSRGDTMDEKKVRLRNRFPEGDVGVIQDPGFGTGEGVFQTGGGQMLVYRENPDDKWKRVDPEGFEMGDVVEAIGPSIEAIVGETAMALRSRGLSIPATIGRQVIGAVAGEGFEQAEQYALGKQRQSPSEVASEIGMEGAASLVGGLIIGSPLSGIKNIGTGAGALRVGQEGIETLQAANRLSPEMGKKMTPGMVTDNPAIGLSERQSAALVPGLQRRYRELITLADDAVRNNVPGSARNASSQIAKALQTMQDRMVARFRNLSSSSMKTAGEGGEALKAGLAEYNVAQRNLVGAAYDAARSIEDPVFDTKTLFSMISDLRKGAKGKLDPRVESVIKDIEKIEGPIELTDGRMLSVTDQYRNARTQLYSLRSVPPGQVADQSTGQANDLYKSISQMMENPSNINPAFRKAWADANTANRVWKESIEKQAIIRIARSENPAELLSFARPGQVGNLQLIKDVVPTQKWNEFVSSFYSEVLNNPSMALDRINKFDKETLDALVPSADQPALKRVATELDRIFKVGVEELQERQVTNINFIDRLIKSSDPRTAQTIIRAANETNNKSMRESVRGAIVEWAWNGVIAKEKNSLAFNKAALDRNVETLKSSGLWRLLSPNDKQVLSDASTVGKAFKDMIDAGTSIRAAEAVAGVQKLHAGAIMTFIRAGMVGQLYTSDFGRRILIGSGLPNGNGPFLRVFGGALAQVSVPEDISKLSEQRNGSSNNN